MRRFSGQSLRNRRFSMSTIANDREPSKIVRMENLCLEENQEGDTYAGETIVGEDEIKIAP